MKVMITGGAGYKGAVLAGRLLNEGHHVSILDNFVYGFDSILHLVNHQNLEIIRQDIRNLTSETLRSCDVIYHLAGLSGYPACEANPHSAQLINVEASRRLAELASPDQQVIYASTTSFYGSSGMVCDEDAPVQPGSLYGTTKYQAEQILMQRSNTISLRFATIFGVSPRMRIDLLVNDFTFRAVNDRCIVHERARVGGRELFTAYREWCDARHAPADERLSQKAFGLRIKERFPDVGTARKTVYGGIGLQTTQPLDFNAEEES